MPEPKPKPTTEKPPEQGKEQPVQKQEPGTPPPSKPEKKKETPAQKKQEGLKYEMTYVNGGFNNGVQIKPDKGGKALVEISIYGGGEKKTLSVGPLPASISKLVQAYEISATQNSDAPEITGELQRWFEDKNNKLSIKIIQILTEADQKIASAIKEVFKS